MELTIESKFRLNNGVEIPVLGLGVYLIPSGEKTQKTVTTAFDLGYRHVDTAKLYGNESDVGSAVREISMPRSGVFVTTKLWNSDHGYEAAIKACDESLKKLGLDYIDLYLIHWPVEKIRLETWRALETLYDEKKCRAIGVSNYMVRHLNELLDNCAVKPMVNQIELSPYNYTYRKAIIDMCRQNGIVLEAYSPLTKGHKLQDARLSEIAIRYKKTPAQILIRWALEHQLVVLPKSNNPKRIQENADLFDFFISEQDMNLLDSFNENLITSWDPTDAP